MKIVENYSEIPFAEPGDDCKLNANKKSRVKVVREFIGMNLSTLHTLDIGAPNTFGQLLGIKDNTLRTDLHREMYAPSSEYDLILFSEIPEHIGNLLARFDDCYALLKPGGLLIVSTPIPNMIFYQSPHHLAEYRPDRLRKLMEYAGFEVVKYKKICIWDPLPFMFTGLRPFLRVLFHRSQLWMMRKKP